MSNSLLAASGCIESPKSLDSSGYPQIGVGGRLRLHARVYVHPETGKREEYRRACKAEKALARYRAKRDRELLTGGPYGSA